MQTRIDSFPEGFISFIFLRIRLSVNDKKIKTKALTRRCGGSCGGTWSSTYGGAARGSDFPSFRGFRGWPPRHFRYLIIFHLFDHDDRRRANWRLGRRRDGRRCGPRIMMVYPTSVIILLGLDWNNRQRPFTSYLETLGNPRLSLGICRFVRLHRNDTTRWKILESYTRLEHRQNDQVNKFAEKKEVRDNFYLAHLSIQQKEDDVRGVSFDLHSYRESRKNDRDEPIDAVNANT